MEVGATSRRVLKNEGLMFLLKFLKLAGREDLFPIKIQRTQDGAGQEQCLDCLWPGAQS